MLALTLTIFPLVAIVAAQSGAVTAEEQKAPQELDLEALEQRLRETRAIGFFTKLALKNQIDDLLNRFRAYHRGRPGIDLEELHEDYDLLLLKVLSLLQDDDSKLARDIAASREVLWEILTDPEQFAEL